MLQGMAGDAKSRTPDMQRRIANRERCRWGGEEGRGGVGRHMAPVWHGVTLVRTAATHTDARIPIGMRPCLCLRPCWLGVVLHATTQA